MKNVSILFYLSLLIIFISSCSKENMKIENLNENTFPTDVVLSTELEQFDLNVNIEDDLLSFESFELFQEALTKLSSVENGYFTSEAIANWQKRIGFKSMGVKYQSAIGKFENIDSDASYDQFILNHPDIKMSDDSETDDIILPVPCIQLAYLLNEEGKVIIGDNLHMFTDKHQIIVMDKGANKLQIALENLESNEALGIHVIPSILDEIVTSDVSSVNLRSYCGTNHDGQEQSGNKKVVSEIRLIFTAAPRGFLNGGGWDYFVIAKFKGKSEKKNWRGRWKGYSRNMRYYQHYSVHASVNGSTSNPDRQYDHYDHSSSFSYNQHLITGYSIFNTAPIMSGAFNFWKHKVFNFDDAIYLQRWCYS